MNKFDQNKYQELVIDEWIWVIFIILSFLNIIGDEIEKHYCLYQEETDKTKSKKIFTFTVFVSFLIYIYLAIKNYQRYQNEKSKNIPTNLLGIKVFASTLVVIASAIFLYTQIEDNNPQNPSID